MKKSSFMALVLGTAGGLLLSVGMCMMLIPQWDTLQPGILLGVAGVILLCITVMLWRKMEGKPLVRLSGKLVLRLLVGNAGFLLLGIGMCCCLVWEKMVMGILVGIGGILVLLFLIPLIWGIK